jgi:myo-inositol-1(or 4)-monophosphatase
MASSTSTSTSTSSIPITLASSDLLSILATTTALARKAGAVILEGSDALHYAPADDANAVDEKKNSVDLVTAYDVRVEQLLLGELEKMYPGFGL